MLENIDSCWIVHKMPKILLFVHGTGVRASAYAATAGLIERQLRRHGLETVQFAPCLWGDRFGARLSLEGKSIPSYGESRSADQSFDDTSPAVWDLLLQDPTFELSTLASLQTTGEIAPPSGLPALDALLENFQSLSASRDYRAELLSMGLDHLVAQTRVIPRLRESLDEIARSAGFQDCARAPIAGEARHRSALARAVVANIQKMALEDGTPLLDAPNRDELVMRVERLLAADTHGVISASLASLKGLMVGLATWQGRRKRTSLTDASFPAAGDILRYQLHGKALREYLRERVEAYPDHEVYILAHSLGGVAAVETMIEHDLPNVKRLITFGSQAPFFYEIDALATLPAGEPLPAQFPAWSNFYDLNDPLSYVGESVFEERVTDYRVESGESFPASHSAYLHSKPLWVQLAALINNV